jgi:hypothetical protein
VRRGDKPIRPTMSDDSAPTSERRSAWGRKGGETRAKRLTADERQAIALKAAAVRWKGISPADRSRALREAALARWGKRKKSLNTVDPRGPKGK